MFSLCKGYWALWRTSGLGFMPPGGHTVGVRRRPRPRGMAARTALWRAEEGSLALAEPEEVAAGGSCRVERGV